MPQHISTVENTLKTEAMAEDLKNPLLMLSNRTIKRTFDLFAGLLVCIISLPFLPFIALIIKMQSRGPIVFKQERTGLDGKTFVCYKFRTMRLNDECDTLQATAHAYSPLAVSCAAPTLTKYPISSMYSKAT